MVRRTHSRVHAAKAAPDLTFLDTMVSPAESLTFIRGESDTNSSKQTVCDKEKHQVS